MDNLRAMRDQLDDYLGQISLLPNDLETPFFNPSTPNVVPSLDHQDALHVDAIVSQRNAQLSTLIFHMASVDSAIQKLVTIRAALEESSANVRRSLLAHQALTSPLRRIPPEVLGEVFYHCLPKTQYITPSDIDSPIVLTRVCRHWRDVAVATPCLWSCISIHLQKAVDEAYRRGCETWSARAKSVPLTVRVVNDILILSDLPLASSPLHWLRPLVACCSDLWWHGPSLPTLFVQETGAEIDLPLERLRITSHRDAPSIHFPGFTRCLRFASFQCLNHDLQSLNEIHLPWDNLVELNMHFALFSSTLFIHLLARCGQLHTLVVSCLCADDVQLSALRALLPGSIVHPTLRRIEIKIIRAGLDMIFGVLTLPALEELDVCFCYRERDTWPHASFMEMVARSQCPLKRLTVRSNKNAAAYFGEYVEAIPGLAVSASPPDPLSQ